MDVFSEGCLNVYDGDPARGPNLILGVLMDVFPIEDELPVVEQYEQLFPREVEALRDALTDWLRSIGREREAA